MFARTRLLGPRAVGLLGGALLALLVLGPPAHADSWAPRDHLVVHSPDGTHYAIFVHRHWALAERRGEGPFVPPKRIRLESVTVDGGRARVPTIGDGDRLVSFGETRGTPLDAHVLTGGAGVVLFDWYGGTGEGAVVTHLRTLGDAVFAWTLGDLFSAEDRAAFVRSVSSVHWSRGWWVDEVGGVVCVAYGGEVLGLGLGSSSPGGLLAIPLDGAPPRPPESDTLRRAARRADRTALLALDGALAAEDTDTTWLTALFEDDDAHPRARVHAEVALHAVGRRPSPSYIEATLAETTTPLEPTGDRRADARAAQERSALRSEAIEALPAARGKDALPVLLALLKTRGDRRAALRGIERIAEHGGARALSRLLADADAREDARGAAARGLGATGDARHRKQLTRMLDDAEGALAVAVTEALADMGALDELLAWATTEPRAALVARGLAGSQTPQAVGVTLQLVEAGLLGSAGAVLVLRGRTGGRVVAQKLLVDDVVEAEPILQWLRDDPGPDVAAALLVVLDRTSGPPRDALADALARSLDRADPLVERLAAGHPADGTILRAFRTLDPTGHEDALLAAVVRHLDPDDPAFEDALRVTRHLRSPACAQALIPALQMTDTAQRAAADLLREHPEVEATAPLLDAMEAEEDRLTCERMARALAERDLDAEVDRIARFVTNGGADCVGPIIKAHPRPAWTRAASDALTTGPIPSERYELVYALARTDDPEAMPGLAAALSAEHSGPVRAAAKALRKRGDDGVQALAGVLRTGVDEELSVLAALNEGKDPLPPGILEPVTLALARADALGGEDGRRRQRMALLVLGRIRGHDIVPRLVERLESGAGPIGDIARQLIGLEDPRAADALLASIDAVDGKDRNAVLRALAEIPEPRVVPILLRELLDTPAGDRAEGWLVTLLRAAVPEHDRPVGDRSRTNRAAAWRQYARATLAPPP